MVEKTNRCFRESDGLLKSSDGTELRLFLDASAPSNRVRAVNYEVRHNSEQWGADIDCPTLIHEAMHLLGLVDGYKEQVREGLECRHIEPMTSVMSSTTLPLNQRLDIFQCDYPNAQSMHEKIFNEHICTRQPSRSSVIWEGNNYLLNSYNSSEKNRERYSQLLTKSSFTLSPAQTRLITKPFCDEENQKYLTCSENAYRGYSQGCIQTPEFCLDGSYLD
ncbi:MAG: hypothetical protein ACRBBP_06275 [Bdellovibrionales bacterium]